MNSSTKAASISVPIIPETAPCIDQQNDVLLPVFGECSQFYGCKHGKATLINCQEGLFFDAETKNCTEASKSNCVQEQLLSVSSNNNSEIKPTSENPEIEEIPKYICLGKAIGSLVPSRTNCSEYYSCISSHPNLMTCGMSMDFDSYSQKCIPSELSSCVIKEKVHLTTTRKPKLIETVCKGMFDGEKFPVPGNCSKYFDCLGHKAYEKSCGDKHFYPISRTCIDPDVSECFEGNVRVKSVSTESNEDSGNLDEDDVKKMTDGDKYAASRNDTVRMSYTKGV
ncbi:probable chitinase 10 [Eupeodes corollae]|uniref:probable chitinase 10 n=1 Tax=Eupeodes corollae TaxID=290404 RepID=UPI0024901DCE|nr:probable chitinase 10 [Eupeodes corollae]